MKVVAHAIESSNSSFAFRDLTQRQRKRIGPLLLGAACNHIQTCDMNYKKLLSLLIPLARLYSNRLANRRRREVISCANLSLSSTTTNNSAIQ